MFYLLSLASAPVIVLFTYFYVRDKHEREPLRYLILAFFLGVVSVVPVAAVSFTGEHLLGILPLNFGSGLLFRAFLLAALVEEGIKFLILWLLFYRLAEFDEPYDGIMYAVAIGLGFACAENILYVATHGEVAGWMRMLSAVPAHAIWAVILGYYMGLAKFTHEVAARPRFMVRGLMAAVVAHGIYDFAAFSQTIAGSLMCFALVLAQGLFARRAIVAHNKREEHRVPEDIKETAITGAMLYEPRIIVAVSWSAIAIFSLLAYVVLFSILITDIEHDLSAQSARFLKGGAMLSVALSIVSALVVVTILRDSKFGYYVALCGALIIFPTPLFPFSVAALFGLFALKRSELGAKETG